MARDPRRMTQEQRDDVRAILVARGTYGGDCAACKYPVVEGRTLCRTCERLVETSEGSG